MHKHPRKSATVHENGQLFTAKDLSFKFARDVKIYLWICLLFYLAVPVFYYHFHLDWTMVDSFYFCMVTFASVGYGDIVPDTKTERFWTCVFIIIGVGFTANMFSILSAFYLDVSEQNYDALGADEDEDKGEGEEMGGEVITQGISNGVGGGGGGDSVVGGTGVVNDTNDRSISSGAGTGIGNSNNNNSSSRSISISYSNRSSNNSNHYARSPHLKHDSRAAWTSDENIRKLRLRNPGVPAAVLMIYAYIREGIKLWCVGCRRVFDWVTFYREPELIDSSHVHTPIHRNSNNNSNSNSRWSISRWSINSANTATATGIDQVPRYVNSSSNHSGVADTINTDTELDSHRLTTWETGVSSVNKIRKIVQKYHRSLQDIRYSVLLGVLSLIVLVLIGTLSMMSIEDFTADKSFFWALTTVTSVGYGNIVPNKPEGKIFTTFYIFFAYILVSKFLSDIILAPIGLRSKKNSIEIISQFENNLTQQQLDSLINSEIVHQIPDFYQHPGTHVCKSELMLLILHIMGTVSADDMTVAAEIFDRFDSSGTRGGKISLSDMQKVLLMARRRGSSNTSNGDGSNSSDVPSKQSQKQYIEQSTTLSLEENAIELSSTMNPVVTNNNHSAIGNSSGKNINISDRGGNVGSSNSIRGDITGNDIL